MAVSGRFAESYPVATINATPSATARTVPNESTVATPRFELTHVNARVGPIAVMRMISPGTRVARWGDTTTSGAYPGNAAVGPPHAAPSAARTETKRNEPNDSIGAVVEWGSCASGNAAIPKYGGRTWNSRLGAVAHRNERAPVPSGTRSVWDAGRRQRAGACGAGGVWGGGVPGNCPFGVR